MTRGRWTMRWMLVAVLGGCAAAWAQDQAAAYTRDGFDYFSATVEEPAARSGPNACEKQYGANAEVREASATEKETHAWQCDVFTASEPRLSAKLRDEIALIDLPEPRRQKLVDALVDKYKRLAQCPAGTAAYYDGSMYLCGRTFTAKELCPTGVPVDQESGKLACVTYSCPAGASDLGALTAGQHPGCFKCPRGTYDAKETEAFHGALKGMPADFTEVFCKAPARGAKAR